MNKKGSHKIALRKILTALEIFVMLFELSITPFTNFASITAMAMEEASVDYGQSQEQSVQEDSGSSEAAGQDATPQGNEESQPQDEATAASGAEDAAPQDGGQDDASAGAGNEQATTVEESYNVESYDAANEQTTWVMDENTSGGSSTQSQDEASAGAASDQAAAAGTSSQAATGGTSSQDQAAGGGSNSQAAGSSSTQATDAASGASSKTTDDAAAEGSSHGKQDDAAASASSGASLEDDAAASASSGASTDDAAASASSTEDKEKLEKEKLEKEKLEKEKKEKEDKEKEENKEVEIIEGELYLDEAFKISFDKDAEIPEGAELVAGEVSGEELEEYLGTAYEATGLAPENVAGLKVLDISIVKDDEEIQPKSEVYLELGADYLFGERALYADDSVMVVHINGDEADTLGCDVICEEEDDGNSAISRKARAIGFSTGSFSPFVIMQLASEKSASVSGGGYDVTVSYDNTSGIPAGTELVVNEVGDTSGLGEQSAALFDGEVYTLEAIRAFDISFVDRESGDHYQPGKDISVSLCVSSDWYIEGAEPYLIRFDGEAAVVDAGTDEQGYSFGTSSLSTYGVAQFSVKKTMTAGDGSTYLITVNYDSVSGIPEGAVLSVTEITDNYDSYAEKSSGELGEEPEMVEVVRAFDISFRNPDTGEEYQPTKGVSVSIDLFDEDLDERSEDLDIVHIHGESEEQAEVVDSAVNEGVVEFETEAFSVFVVVRKVIEQTLTASDGQEYLITVSFDSTAGIPQNAELVVNEIKKGEAGYEKYLTEGTEKLEVNKADVRLAKIFDISLKDSESGETYQPTKGVNVSIQLLTDTFDEDGKVDVIHFGEETQVMEVAVEGQTVKFETDGFSIYEIINSGTPLRTYSFYTLDNAGNYVKYFFETSDGVTVYQETIKGNEKPVTPQLPSHTTLTFAGWYEYHPATDTYEDSPYDFERAPAVTVTEEVILRAKFMNYAYVIFHDQYNGSSKTFPIAATRRAERNASGVATVTISDMEVAYDDSISKDPNNPTTTVSKMIFRGWSLVRVQEPGAENGVNYKNETAPADLITADSTFTYDPNDPLHMDEPPVYAAVESGTNLNLEIGGTVHLYPLFIGVHWLDLYTAESGQGASYYSPMYYTALEGEGSFATTSTKHPISNLLPTRPGYTFAGWYTGTKVYQDPDTKKIFDHIEYGTKIVNANGTLNTSGTGAAFDSTGKFVGDAYVANTDIYVSDGKLMLNKDIMLFAKWEIGTANYTIVVWQQNVSGVGYDYAYSESKTAQADSSVDFTGSNAGYLEHAGQEVTKGGKTINFKGFHLSSYDNAKTVSGNGSTILNVYYDRNWMIIYFWKNNKNVFNIGSNIYTYTSTTGTNTPQYGYVDGEFIQLTRGITRVYYTYSSGGTTREYSGVFYTRSGWWSYYTYNETQYNSDNLPPDDGVTYYGKTGNSYNELTRRPEYTWTYTKNGQTYTYTGTRFTRSNNTSNGLMWVGLYGQTFEQAGYSWDTVSGFRWNDQSNGNGTTQTLLDGFTRLENPYNLYCQGNSGNYSINHYKQNVDGTYTESNAYVAHTSNSSGNFYFSNKFEGFTVSTYSTKAEGFKATGGTHDASDGTQVNESYPIYIYHVRNIYTIRFLDSQNNNELRLQDYKYGQPLTELNSYGYNEGDLTVPTGMSFSGWYADSVCSTRVYFKAEGDLTPAESSKSHVCYETMPAGGLQIYAGWTANDYLVIVDPNGGQLTGNESTWFFATYGDPDDGIIKIYDDVTRNFIETADPGNLTPYYYCVHDREWWYHYYGWTGEVPTDRNEPFATPFMPTVNGVAVDCNGPYATPKDFEKGVNTGTTNTLIPERGAMYTPDETLSTDGKMYVYSAGAYRFSGWYEVKLDSNNKPTNEELIYRNDNHDYVDHITYLRAHWKQVGTYRLQYEAGENGILDNDDNNNETFTFIEDEQDYIDKSNVVVTRSVTVKPGKMVNFVGWKVRGDDSGKVYSPGEPLEFPSRYAILEVQEGGKEEYVLYLDAVYRELSTVKLIYDANGGTIDSNLANVDFGRSLDTDPDAPQLVKSVDDGKAIVLGMRNNTGYVLSDGRGFSNGYGTPGSASYEAYDFTGWNTKPDGSGTHFDLGAYSADTSKDIFLDVSDGLGGSKPVTLYAEWKVRVYFDKNRDQSDWGGAAGSPNTWNAPYVWDNDRSQYYIKININSTVTEPPYTPRDTHTPTAEDPLRNFAYWSSVRYTDDAALATEYDYTQPVTGQITLFGFWRSPIEVPYHVVDASAEDLALVDAWKTEPGHFSVTVGTDISVANPVADGFVDLPSGKTYTYAFACLSDVYTHVSGENRIKAVFYDTTNRAAAVRMEDNSERLLDPTMEIHLVYYEDPLTPNITYTYMNTQGVLQNINASVNAAAPKIVQPYISSVPANTDVLPYVPSASVYTVGTQVTSPKAWSNNSDYKYYAFAIGKPGAANDSDLNLITKIENSDSTRPNLQIKNTWRGLMYSLDGTNWSSGGYNRELYVVYFTAKPTIITLEELTIGTRSDVLQEVFNFRVVITERQGTEVRNVSNTIYSLKSGENRSVTVFYTAAVGSTQEITQTAVITEERTTAQSRDFKTERSLDNGTTYTETTSYSYTTSNTSADHKVIFKNTRKQKEIEIHIAYLDARGYIQNDSLRTTNESITKVIVPIYEQKDISGKQSTIMTGSSDEYKFLKIVSGIPDENGVLANVRDVNPGTVHFDHLLGSDYYDLYLDNDTNKQLENDEIIYYVYYRMPRIYYVRESGSGALTPIDPLQHDESRVTIKQLDGTTEIVNGQLLPMSENGTFLISQINEVGRSWMMANFLNDNVRINNLRYARLGVGTVGVTNKSNLKEVSSTNLRMSLKVLDGQVQYSYDDTTWSPFTGAPAVYAIYRERGCDLHIKLIADDESLESTSFKVVIKSDAITENFYSIAGYGELAQIAANTTEKTITLGVDGQDYVKHGCDIVISGLQTGTYTVTEYLDLDELDASMKLDDAEITVTKTNIDHSTEDTAAGQVYINTNTHTSRVLEITNKRGAIEVLFKKINGFGKALAGAEFSLYQDYQCTAVVQVLEGSSKVTKVTSKATFETAEDGETKYNVYFKALPGLYYMKELNIKSNTWPYETDTYKYRVIVGEVGYTKAGLTKAPSDPEVKIERLKDASTVDDNGPDIAHAGIVNISTATRKVILKKTDNSFTLPTGAKFEILRYDRSKVESVLDKTAAAGEKITEFTCGNNNVYFVDDLPYGYYIVREIVTPGGYSKFSDGTNWFILTVDKNGVDQKRGVTITNRQTTELKETTEIADLLGP
nr:SpaA isopeptide-forming pilin-related protein [uncultured Butyrivibrio sp.]